MQDHLTVDLADALRALRLRYGDGLIRRGPEPLGDEIWPSRMPALDQLLPRGGFPKGRLMVVAGDGQRTQPHTTTGQRSILGALLTQATREGLCAYVDLPGTLDMGYLYDAGLVSRDNCFVMRPAGGATGPGLAMGRTLLRSGLPWLAVALPPQPGAERDWTHPLSALVQATWRARAILVVSASAPLPPALAHAASIVLTVSPAEWHRKPRHLRPSPATEW